MVESARAALTSRSIRCTEQRLAVFEALRASRVHPTAEEIFRMARAQVERLSLATVYNTLEVLCDAGLARRMPMSNGCCRYDGDVSDHMHVRVPQTGEILDVPAELGRSLLGRFPLDVVAEIERRLGVAIEGLNVQFVGRPQGPDAVGLNGGPGRTPGFSQRIA
jgi:Fe2+ or Zn2+ uptake regulation protein